ncbi:MAG: protein translocase subunit SecF [Treponema sp.]|jgi:preprotein translocase subunit SecF|nr:protein translocase subunit SecF [Treponema sp.]
MKKIIRFSKLNIPFTIFSCVIIGLGIFSAFTRGINFGIDFKPGLIQEIRIVPPVISLSYDGLSNVSVETNSSGVTLVITGASENNTINFYYGKNPTIADMVASLSSVDGVTATALVSGSESSIGMFTNSEVSSVLSKTPFSLFRASEKPIADVDQVRDALSELGDVSVKATGSDSELSFQIRSADGKDKEMRDTRKNQIYTLLSNEFGKENIAVIKTDFIASNFSKGLVMKSIYLVLATLVLICVYVAIRFKWDLALAAVIAIIHDALILVSFVIFTQMEFSSITIAAVLTIVGYSINDTVVILDRIRENIKISGLKSFTEIWDLSQTEMLSRTLITTATTMLAVLALYIFVPGQMKDFALALIVGMIAGVYSTIYIAGSFACFCRRKWKPSDELKQTV